MDCGEDVFMDRPQQEDEQRLREALCERRSVGICCDESSHAEAVDPWLRPFHTVSLGTSVNSARCPHVRCRRGSVVWAPPCRVKQSKETTKEKKPMRAIVLESFESSPALREVPTPQIAPNEVLVRVRASSVNPVDGAIAGGMLKDMVEHEFPIVLGRDFAGVVEQAGSDVRGLSVGDEVFGFVPGMGPTVHNGSWAELIAVPQSVATRKPDDID